MPIYEYRCDACGEMRELILRPGETASPKCTACRKKMRRVISPTAFVLKGAGWYVTDYPSEARKKGLEAERGAATAPEKKAPEKAPEKPAEKAATAGQKKEGAGAKKPHAQARNARKTR